MWGWANSQHQGGGLGASSGWAWSQWGPSQAAQEPQVLQQPPRPAAPPGAAATRPPATAPPVAPPLHAPSARTAQPPHSRSSLAALAAQRAHQRAGGAAPADPFAFDEAPPQHPAAAPAPTTRHPAVPAPAAAAADDGPAWRGRATSFLMQPAPAASTARPQQQQQAWKQAVTAPAPARQPPPPAPKPVKPAAGQAAAAAPPPPQPAARAAQAPLPPAAATLPLERYLDLWRLLGKGSGRVQPLSELEKGVLKAADLRQVLLVNGMRAGERSKKDVLDRMGGLPLWAPLCLLPDAAPAAAAEAAVQPVGQEAMAALGWAAPTTAAAATSMGGGSCCALPPVRIRLPEGQELPAAAAAAAAAGMFRQQQRQQPKPYGGRQASPAAAAVLSLPQPADSEATVASVGAAGRPGQVVQTSPEVAQPRSAGQAVQQQQQQQQQQAAPGAEQEEEEEEKNAPPSWLVEGIASVAERSQGSRDVVAGPQLLGRRVAFVLLEDFEQADPQGITDGLDAGVQEGQVVEQVGVAHDEDCPPGCTQRHAFHYVRVPASRSTAADTSRRRLDLVVDLQQALRQPELDRLLGLGDEELQDAWVLLEPRAEPEEAPPPAPIQRQQQQQQQAGGAWRTKRGAAPAAARPAKRR